jgi:hypothetical protein
VKVFTIIGNRNCFYSSVERLFSDGQEDFLQDLGAAEKLLLSLRQLAGSLVVLPVNCLASRVAVVASRLAVADVLGDVLANAFGAAHSRWCAADGASGERCTSQCAGRCIR